MLGSTGERWRWIATVLAALQCAEIRCARMVLQDPSLPPVHGAHHPDEAWHPDHPDRWLVQFKPHVSAVDIKGHCATLPGMYNASCHTHLEDHGLVSLHAPDGALDSLRAGALREHIAFIEPDYKISVAQVADDGRTTSWALDRLDQMDLPLDNTFSPPPALAGQDGYGTHIYVLDTGLDVAHTEFTGRVGLTADLTVPGHPESYSDCNGHGTYVAGLAAGTTWGVAKRATIHPVVVMDCQGHGLLSTAMLAMAWVRNHHLGRTGPSYSDGSLRPGPTGVIIMPFASPYTANSDMMFNNFIERRGFVVVTSAGNNAGPASTSPCMADKVLCVGATDENDNLASFSNSALNTWLYAPGVNVIGPLPLSAKPGFAPGVDMTDDYAEAKSGTSGAAALTAGVAALYLAAYPDATPPLVRAGLLSMAKVGGVHGVDPNSPNYLLNLNPNPTDARIFLVPPPPYAPYTPGPAAPPPGGGAAGRPPYLGIGVMPGYVQAPPNVTDRPEHFAPSAKPHINDGSPTAPSVAPGPTAAPGPRTFTDPFYTPGTGIVGAPQVDIPGQTPTLSPMQEQHDPAADAAFAGIGIIVLLSFMAATGPAVGSYLKTAYMRRRKQYEPIPGKDEMRMVRLTEVELGTSR